MSHFFFFDSIQNGTVEWVLAANKGEWSELYTLFKLLSDQSLRPVDSMHDENNGLRLPILSILRHTNNNIHVEYSIDDTNGDIKVGNTADAPIIKRSVFTSIVNDFFDSILAGSDASFGIPSIDEFRHLTKCPKIKSFSKKLPNGNTDKSDLYIVIHDVMTGQTPIQGFSIKSEIGSPPTLLNASEATNFIYSPLTPLSSSDVTTINNFFNNKGKRDIAARVKAIVNLAGIKFVKINEGKQSSCTFYENLTLVDSRMPEILAHLLLLSYTTGEKSIDKLTEILKSQNPLGLPMRTNNKMYEAKVKRLLMDFALGMLPSEAWDESFASKGMLVVKDDGMLDCYHVIYKETLEEYLYHNIKFETASTSRHKFGDIETDGAGNQYYKLNLQLRFKK